MYTVHVLLSKQVFTLKVFKFKLTREKLEVSLFQVAFAVAVPKSFVSFSVPILSLTSLFLSDSAHHKQLIVMDQDEFLSRLPSRHFQTKLRLGDPYELDLRAGTSQRPHNVLLEMKYF